MEMPQQLQTVYGHVNNLSNLVSGVLMPIINLLLAVSALIIVVGCVYNAVEHVMNLRKERDVLSAIALGADLVVASVFLELITATGTLNVLYVVATAAVAVGVRMGVAKLSR